MWEGPSLKQTLHCGNLCLGEPTSCLCIRGSPAAVAPLHPSPRGRSPWPPPRTSLRGLASTLLENSLIFHLQHSPGGIFSFFLSKCCISLLIKSKSDQALGRHLTLLKRRRPVEFHSYAPPVGPAEARSQCRAGNTLSPHCAAATAPPGSATSAVACAQRPRTAAPASTSPQSPWGHWEPPSQDNESKGMQFPGPHHMGRLVPTPAGRGDTAPAPLPGQPGPTVPRF